MRKLGENQASMLRSLEAHGYWYSYWNGSAGWLWDTDSGTRRILESLVKRELVKKESMTLHPRDGFPFKGPVDVYTVSRLGRKWLEA